MVEFKAGPGIGRGYLSIPTTPKAGILLLHAWWGLNSFFKQLSDRLANEGYTVLAPDLNQGKVAATIDEAKAIMSSRDEEEVVGPVAAGAVEYLRTQPSVAGRKIGAIGFSMGAAWALHLSTKWPADIAAVVVFYGTYAVDFSQARAAYLGHYAPDDEWEPIEEVKSLEKRILAAGREAQFHFYPDTKHWFFENNRPNEYDPEAASLAWKRTIEFFRSKLVK